MLSLSWLAWLSVILIQAIAYFGFLGRKGPRGSSSPSSSSSSSLSNDCHENSASKGTESESSSKEKVQEYLQKSEDKLANPQVDSGKSASSKIQVSHCPDTETTKDKEESCDIDENNLEKEKKILSYGTLDTWDTTTSSCQDFVELTAATRRTTVDGPSFSHDASSFQGDHRHHVHVHLHNPDTDTDNSCCIDNECDSIDNECDSIDDEEWRLQLLKDYYYNDEAGGTTGDFYNYNNNNMMEGSVGESPVDSPVPGDSTLQNRISSSETRHSALHATAIQASIPVQ
mmetsp:Transcript_17313/g.32791  ORF Transcript_17313/g.32791 Transcript_17313/m.32791 type:complete len:286 (-) Transcript_17313:177-1034(-)|eukprot:CAMPEP_0176492320 /NCGR_PEP_ID=MMETSP0200_2-20121128/8925_1 /TAXON_ID=947934 /ORGANISM="Chaetoceros sp., Strain GSL56" /LENGTH=285 /DNA_ID=CAMNT_0017889853 /DNA_START=98 /DNA_END=955 /DNA_ORIENTATION=-